MAAGGAIGTPALLLRSQAPDPHGLVGKRTFLHPTVVSAAIMPERIDPFAGAPQTIYSDHFLDTVPLDGPIGYKLEAAPAHPLLMAITLPGAGQAHARWMRELPHLHVAIALLRDGFHPDSPGGTVTLDRDGAPVLDYPLTPYVWNGVRQAFRTMAELQFAAGARTVMPIHGEGVAYDNPAKARAAIDRFALAPLVTPVVSAHVMGGCPLGSEPRAGRGRPDRTLPPSREPARARRLALSDVARRESAALDLRDRGPPRHWPRHRAARDHPRRDRSRAATGRRLVCLL